MGQARAQRARIEPVLERDTTELEGLANWTIANDVEKFIPRIPIPRSCPRNPSTNWPKLDPLIC